jgi:hypothetical protein
MKIDILELTWSSATINFTNAVKKVSGENDGKSGGRILRMFDAPVERVIVVRG